MRTLQLYRILDSESNAMFDDLTRLAAAICESPISLISLVDQDRQWFLSRVGLDVPQTPRDISFCAHAINQNDVFVVEDASLDPRFATNPLVTSEPRIRFYAGAPLVMANGSSLGTLCVIDHKSRHLTGMQLEALKTLRAAVVTQLELRRALEDLRSLAQLIPMCAWCRSVQNAEGRWLSPHDYVAETGLVTHGMCPDCSAQLNK